MERLAELISKLKEQFEQKADPTKLLGITLQIEEELMGQKTAASQVLSSTNVSVVMPAVRNGFKARSMEMATQGYSSETVIEEKIPEKAPPARVEQAETIFGPMKEIPTLAHQQTTKEINEIIGLRDSSLNDKLKDIKVEVGHKLTDSPIRDLKRAIGINDRYVFINELFRGDEVMYERSLKTINGFSIFAEADYWIERELKVKLGWEDHKETPRLFCQLVKRRFS